MKDNKYNIIWIDDSWEARDLLKSLAESCNIRIEPFKIGRDGIDALRKEAASYDAVLMDVNIYNETENESADSVGMYTVKQALDKDFPDIHYYIYTDDDDCKSKRIIKNSLSGKKLYSSAEVLNLSFFQETIIKDLESKDRIKIQKQYKDFYCAFDRLIEDDGLKKDITDILLALHYSNNSLNPTHFYNRLRQVVEFIFKKCNECGLLPDDLIEGRNGTLNTTNSVRYLNGENITKKSGSGSVSGFRYGKAGESIITESINQILNNLLHFCHKRSHARIDTSEDYEYKYLIFSLTLQLCDVVIWFERYIREHSVTEENKLKKYSLYTADYEGREYELSKDEEENWFIDECLCKITKVGLKETKLRVRLTKVVVNADSKTCKKYLYYCSNLITL